MKLVLPLPVLTSSLRSEWTCDVCTDLREKVDEQKLPTGSEISFRFCSDSDFPVGSSLDAVFFGLALVPD